MTVDANLFDNHYKLKMVLAFPGMASGVQGRLFDPWSATYDEREEAFKRLLGSKNLASTHLSYLRDKKEPYSQAIAELENLKNTRAPEVSDHGLIYPPSNDYPSKVQIESMEQDVVGYYDPAKPDKTVWIQDVKNNSTAMLAYYATEMPIVRLHNPSAGIDVTVPLSAMTILYSKIFPEIGEFPEDLSPEDPYAITPEGER